MTKFLLKCFFITTVLFLGVLLGIQIASNNMVKMTGDSSYSTANVIKKEKSIYAGEIEQIEEKLTSHDLEKKQQKLEKIETFNLFSQIGMKLSDLLNKVFSNLLTQLTASLGKVLS